MTQPSSRSSQLYERALRVLPGGVSRNAVLRRPHPFYAAKGEGCRVTDVEGVCRIDFANNIASLVHGHAHPVIVEAVTKQLQRGTAFTFATEAEVIFAEHICSRSRRDAETVDINRMPTLLPLPARNEWGEGRGEGYSYDQPPHPNPLLHPMEEREKSRFESSNAALKSPRSFAFEKIRFVNSGTEAIMCCLKAARAFTGRPKIAKVEGAYHGLYDYAEVSQTAQPTNWGDATHPHSVPAARGTPSSALDDVIVIPFNNCKVALALLEEHADDLACVLVDPLPHRVGLIPASPEFIETLRRWTSANGALLVFDEVITFRSEYGGAQQWFNVQPDITALGKMIGGGFPVGAIAGRAEVMEVLNPLAEKVLFPHSGTFSANPITMTAGLAAMELFDRDAVTKLNKLGERARAHISEAIHLAGIPACVTGAGSMFRIHLKPEPPANYRECYVGPEEARLMSALLDHLFANGIMLIGTGTGTLSTPMTGDEIDTLSEVLLSGFRKIKEMHTAITPVTSNGHALKESSSSSFSSSKTTSHLTKARRTRTRTRTREKATP